MNVFITGGTGYIGTATVAALNQAGHHVEALVRGERGVDGASPVRGALEDLDTLRSAAVRADAVIHLAAADAAADKAAALAILEVLDGPYIHTGGVWVYGDTDGVADEDAPQAPPAIVAWRADNERAVLQAGGRLIMPGLVYGHEAGLIPAFFGDGRVIGDGANHWPLVHVEDIADLYVRALEAPAGARYLGVEAGEPTMRDAVEAIVGPITGSVTAAELGPIGEAFALDQRLSSERARTELGWSPRRSLADNLPLRGPAVR
jgi:nucleoside-diphosphate-sugar epimerase